MSTSSHVIQVHLSEKTGTFQQKLVQCAVDLFFIEIMSQNSIVVPFLQISQLLVVGYDQQFFTFCK